MKRIAVLILPALLLSFVGQAQDPNHFMGDESKCPYLHPEIRNKANTSTAVIDDFENEVTTAKKWSNLMDNGSLHSSIETTDSAAIGKGAAKISFAGTKDKNSWTDLYCKASVPQGKTKVTFWAKAPQATKVLVKVNQGIGHENMEFYGKTIIISTEWKKYEFALNEMTEMIFSHRQYSGKSPTNKVNLAEVFGIGFTESDLPAVIYIDQLQFE